mmetsp:Transcript_31624/g.66261  ORF Transcript_31624/g.66261 Transcript_31624/m.66261 type:complete len:92 (+) Transcript_31624:124-399(+)
MSNFTCHFCSFIPPHRSNLIYNENLLRDLELGPSSTTWGIWIIDDNNFLNKQWILVTFHGYLYYAFHLSFLSHLKATHGFICGNRRFDESH